MSKRKKPVHKGDCYQVAANFAMEHDITLCHGTCTGYGPIKGRRFGHAWAEDGDVVFDVSNGKHFIGRKEIYYAVGKPCDVHKFNPQEVRALILKHRHWGPWPKDSSR